jgi:prepilin-type N-terminal cleavage/methylation domain-containing protein
MFRLPLSRDNFMRHDNLFDPTNPAARRRGASGFSLIELLIAMTLLLVLTALAVPNYLAALSRANEASAASSVRAVITAQNLYRNTFGTFTDLTNLGADYLTDNALSTGQKSGYMFDAAPGAGTAAGLDFTIQATPQLSIGPSATGIRHYYGDQSAVIRFNVAGAADPSSPPM